MTETLYLLDTNVVIQAVERLEPKVLARLERIAPRRLSISIISFAEILRGFGTEEPPGYDMFLSQIAVLPFDEAAARAYAKLLFKRHAFDRLIGAHAKATGATLVTANAADFADIEGLRVEDWTR